jgi:hypothetical protein
VLLGMKEVPRSHLPAIIAECLDKQALQKLISVTIDNGYMYAHRICKEGMVSVGNIAFHPANYLFTSNSMLQG